MSDNTDTPAIAIIRQGVKDCAHLKCGIIPFCMTRSQGEEILAEVDRLKEENERLSNEARDKQCQRGVYMVNVNKDSGCVFVKELEFFKSQGGFVEKWGEHWEPVVAASIEDAREKGCEFPGAKPYCWQSK